jgi:hypothetical protein
MTFNTNEYQVCDMKTVKDGNLSCSDKTNVVANCHIMASLEISISFLFQYWLIELCDILMKLLYKKISQ